MEIQLTNTALIFVLCINVVTSYNNGIGRLPFMGWNTWCTDGICETDVCNENEIKEIANAMLSNGMYDVGYRYISLDDCWSACNRSKNGTLYAEPTRFPNGMASTIEYIHNLKSGLKFGLYTDVGTHTCSGGHRNGCHPPGSYGNYVKDANTLASWKVDLIKADDCSKPSNETWQNVHTEFSVALNKTGRPILFELDGGGNILLNSNAEQYPSYAPNISQAFKIVHDHHDSWSSTKELINLIINMTILSRPYGWAYADLLMTGGQGCSSSYDDQHWLHCPGQTDIEYMTEFAIFAISSSPLLVATDIRNMTDIMKKCLLNKEIIAVNQQDQTPAGNLAYYHDCSGPSQICQVWSRKLNQTNTIAVVAFNIDDKEHGITIEFDKLGMNWNNESKVDVRDLWEQKDVGSFTGSYDTQVSPHGNFFGKLTLVK
eukprot:5426_1